jgi:hypothetical protein
VNHLAAGDDSGDAQLGSRVGRAQPRAFAWSIAWRRATNRGLLCTFSLKEQIVRFGLNAPLYGELAHVPEPYSVAIRHCGDA